MSVVTQLGNGFIMEQFGDGSISLFRGDYPSLALGIDTSAFAIDTARAILAALGEPVEAKAERDDPDTARFARWGFYTEADGDTEYHAHSGGDIERALAYAKNLSQDRVVVYELAGWVGPKPEPAERKAVVVRNSSEGVE